MPTDKAGWKAEDLETTSIPSLRLSLGSGCLRSLSLRLRLSLVGGHSTGLFPCTCKLRQCSLSAERKPEAFYTSHALGHDSTRCLLPVERARVGVHLAREDTVEKKLNETEMNGFLVIKASEVPGRLWLSIIFLLMRPLRARFKGSLLEMLHGACTMYGILVTGPIER
ncbi:uncharacterized protein B0H18DRAFT_961694 [Fomitopsis serialis]|uniref:uncharacterized protein n=1 Tax=Fomitopsis serialis TaxID=139415 RepID=UPI002008C5D1|nr:uncharacterized protein B0H18DRAFT_961694 [Neoantrodia serialis]KAH9911832.1 hypothetical protein B0H18DRAFT_961694 [Neoantrodia serialis]